MEKLKNARAVRKAILTNSYQKTDPIIKERSLTAIVDHRKHLMKIFQLFEDAADDYAEVLTSDSDTDIETADEYYDDEQKLYVEQLVKLNSAMDSLSLSQQPAKEDLSSITAMSEVLNTDILEFQPLDVNHIAVHPECTTLACELELDNLPQNEHSEGAYDQHTLSEVLSNAPVLHPCSEICSKPQKSSYHHQQTLNVPLHAIELCIDSLRALPIVKPLYSIHSGDSESKTLLKQVQSCSTSVESLNIAQIMCLNNISKPPNINSMNNAGMLGYQNFPGG